MNKQEKKEEVKLDKIKIKENWGVQWNWEDYEGFFSPTEHVYVGPLNQDKNSNDFLDKSKAHYITYKMSAGLGRENYKKNILDPIDRQGFKLKQIKTPFYMGAHLKIIKKEDQNE